MSRESLVFVFGFLVFVLPFLGLPRNVKDIVFMVVGGLLMLVGFILRRSAYMRSTLKHTGERQSEAFAESAAVLEEHQVLPAVELKKEV